MSTAPNGPPLAAHTHVRAEARGRDASFVSSIRGPSENGSSLRTSTPAAFPPSSRISGATRCSKGSRPRFSRPASANRRAPLKALLTDQRIVAGIGNHLRGRDLLSGKAPARPRRRLVDPSPRSRPWPDRPGRCSVKRCGRAVRRCGTCAIATSRAGSGPTSAVTRSTTERASPACAAGNGSHGSTSVPGAAYCCEGCQL